MTADRRLAIVVAGLSLLFIGLVYLPDVGHGFLKDDFAWIAAAQRLGAQPWKVFVADASGTFYRPIVTLVFAADHAVYGLRSFGYAITNLLLLVACAAMIARLFRDLGVTTAGAVVAAAVWLLNPHGINMSVLWLSGRTSLVMALLGCTGLWFLVRGRTSLALLAILGAVLSKEDALLLPVIGVALLWAQGVRGRPLAKLFALLLLPGVAYLALRLPSNALTPASAPAFYRLTSDPGVILANTLGYLDRSATAFAVILAVAALIYGAMPVLAPGRRRFVIAGAIWFAAGIAITVRVPVRSSLYAVFPSIGVALMFATAFDAVRARSRRASGDLVLQAVFVVLLLAAPLYRSRNLRWVLASNVSRDTMSAVSGERDQLPSNGLITLEDEPVRFANFSDAFGDATTDALRLYLNRPVDGRIVPSGDRSTHETEVARFVLEDGKVRRVR